jgi:CRISPR-associated protein Cas5h
MKILTFDVFGDYAHFRKYYTTTSPLTFSFPPPPTIAGLLGAICGIPKEETLKVFNLYDNWQVALKIINPVKKIRIGVNFINTKDNKYLTLYRTKTHEPRTPIRTEFVKLPRYRVYLIHKDKKIFEKLIEFIQFHRCVFTVSLGLSELLADFSFVGLYDYEELRNYNGYISSIIPIKRLVGKGIYIEPERKYFKEKIPFKMNPERIIEIYEDVIYEPEGKPIKACIDVAYKIENGEVITFF